MKLKQLRTVVLPLKLKYDVTIPTQKMDLQEAYVAWKGRDPPVFYMIVREYTDTTNGGLNRDGMSNNVAIGNNEDNGTHTIDSDTIEAILELGVVMEV